MPLNPGDQLGPYQILSLLGKGGMGEVYRARDPRLQRDVAIKTSSQRFSERFEREARAIAALNHPNICQIYDIGPNYIVMELVEGEPPKGPLAVEETLHIADQIIAALEAAHEKSITHRDLKPGNILLRTDGVVKVLDFGLAKFGGTPTTPASANEDSPTLSLTMTQAGMILGTAAYMAPEQARGKPVDSRADIWAFGVVVHELLTGERLFKGDDLTETLASVVKEQPDFSIIPRRLRRLVAACLEKDPAKRLQAIGDARLLLDTEEVQMLAVPLAEKPSFPWLWPAVAALLTVVAGVALWAPWRPAPPPPQSVQFPIHPPEGERFSNQFGAFSVSPDGRHVVYLAQGSEGSSLWLRSLDSMVARPIPGVKFANFTFWSPDSKSLAYSSTADNKLKRVDLTGGAPLSLADLGGGEAAVSSAGTWNAEGTILFGSSEGLKRTSSAGGGATFLTHTDPKQKETGHGFPQFLPDGQHFLYFVASGDADVQGVYASSLAAPQQRTLIVRTDAKAIYVPAQAPQPGHLLWMQESNLVAQRFDPDTLQRQGEPTSVAENVSRNSTTPVRAAFWASDAGLLGYLSGAAQDVRRIVWINREGKILGDALPEAALGAPALSPDGTRMAIQRRDSAGTDIGMWEFPRAVATRLTFAAEREEMPVWSPDGKQIAYTLAGDSILRKDAAGVGEPKVVLQANGLWTMDWSPDGKYILYRTQGAGTGRDLWAVSVDRSPGTKPFPVVVAPASQLSGQFSPDGKWVAYSSNESGTYEVYLQPFVEPGSGTNPGGRWQVSNAGGINVVWRKDGRELYYDTLSGDIMAASIEPEAAGLKIGTPKLLFKAGLDNGVVHNFDVTGDGQRFVAQLVPTGSGTTQALTVVTNWQTALKK